MDLNLLKRILSTFNKHSFSLFIYELWKLRDYEDDYKYQKTYLLKEIGKNVYEQHFWGRENQEGIYDIQGFHLIIPFFQPIELFNNIEKINFTDLKLIEILKKYKKIMDDREADWQFWTDGNYIMPNFYFVTNFEGIEKKIYFNVILPKFESILNKLEISGEAAVGSCDSFIEMASENAIKAFKNFFINYKNELSITFNNDKYIIDNFYADKYISKGLLKLNQNPLETIYINENKNKSEIIKEFEYLINHKVNEQKFEQFLTKYYKSLFGEKYDRIETQLWLKFPELDINNKNRRLDIFLRNSIERDWELFELKKPQKLIRMYRNIPAFRSEILQALQQIKNYKKILSQDKVKRKLAREGIEYCFPEFRLVIGNKPDISNEQWRWLKTSNENQIKIITFEDLINEMKIRFNLHLDLLNLK